MAGVYEPMNKLDNYFLKKKNKHTLGCDSNPPFNREAGETEFCYFELQQQ